MDKKIALAIKVNSLFVATKEIETLKSEISDLCKEINEDINFDSICDVLDAMADMDYESSDEAYNDMIETLEEEKGIDLE